VEINVVLREVPGGKALSQEMTIIVLVVVKIKKMEQNFLATTQGKEYGNQPSLV
jgi:hypothetical protein